MTYRTTFLGEFYLVSQASCDLRPPTITGGRCVVPPDTPDKLTNSSPPLPSLPLYSANILLDHHLEAKIGDFGLAREFPQEKHTSLTVTRVHGTRPYLPDEYLRSRKLSEKVDTFSFGVVSWGKGEEVGPSSWDGRYHWFIHRESAQLRLKNCKDV